jgi:hypothetical protein
VTRLPGAHWNWNRTPGLPAGTVTVRSKQTGTTEPVIQVIWTSPLPPGAVPRATAGASSDEA